MTIPPRHKPWAFRALLSLDESNGTRQELADAGVAQHRIDALYPVAFEDLVPGLQRHLIDLGGEHMYLRGDLMQLNSLFEKNKKLLWMDQLRHHQHDLEGAIDQGRLGELRNYLLDTWAATHTEQRPKLAVLHPMWLWSAWWSMTNFEALTEEGQKTTSQLMIAVDEAWQFPRRGKRV